jgi:hypothetical protein
MDRLAAVSTARWTGESRGYRMDRWNPPLLLCPRAASGRRSRLRLMSAVGTAAASHRPAATPAAQYPAHRRLVQVWAALQPKQAVGGGHQREVARPLADESSPGCRRSRVPRETRRAAGRPPMARTGFPPTPGSRHRGSVGGHPRSGGRAASAPAPSDSPSLGTHEAALRPGLCVGTWARPAVAPCAPFLASIPHVGDNLRPSEVNAIQRSTQSEPSRGLTACADRLDNDIRLRSAGVFAG